MTIRAKKAKALFWICAAGLAVAGCGLIETLGGGGAVARQDCSAPVCQVTLHVANCNISDPGKLYVHGKGPHLIIWTLDDANHDFHDARGIKFEKGEGTVFTGKHHAAKGFYQWTDDYKVPGTYKYKIDLKHDNGNNCSIDPDVVNN